MGEWVSGRKVPQGQGTHRSYTHGRCLKTLLVIVHHRSHPVLWGKEARSTPVLFDARSSLGELRPILHLGVLLLGLRDGPQEARREVQEVAVGRAQLRHGRRGDEGTEVKVHDL